jgi:hypothetical protein
MAEFDVKRVTPLELAGSGAGALAFIVSFFPWYSYDFEGIGGASASAWNSGFLAWFAVMLLMGAGVVVLLPHFGVQVARLPLIWLSLAGAATVFILIRWLTLPDDGGLGDLGILGGPGIESGAGFGLIIGLILALVSTAAAFLRFRAAPKPAPGGTNPATA